MNSQNDSNSDLVWARMKYCPFWPARIIADAPPIIGRVPANKLCVFFFGTAQYGLVDLDKVFLYTSHREKYIAKGRGSDFMTAVKSLEDFMSDRKKYHTNANPTLIDNEIQIKKEHDIEKSLGIKSEKKSPEQRTTSAKKSASDSTDPSTWVQEKKKLITKIVGLQTENQRITFDLQKNISQYEAIIQEKENLGQQLSEKMVTLREELKTARLKESNFGVREDRYKETITQLTYENKTLHAQVKQLRAGIHQQKDLKSDSEVKNYSDDVYEVEALIDHKKKRNGMEYLVRWKNFTSKDDTWEKESNLMCPEILQSYKQKMNL